MLLIAVISAIAWLYGVAPHSEPARADDPVAVREAGDLIIPDRYIVTLKPGVNPNTEAVDLGGDLGFEADAVYTQAVRGFVADMSATDAAAVARDPQVLTVEPDGLVSATLHDNLFQTLPTGVDRMDTDLNPIAAITGGGGNLNTDVAILDSGVDTDHPDLVVAGGVSFVGSGCVGTTYEDDNGHGTHVAGIIAAKDDNRGVVGVAPGARIWAVKVLNQSGGGTISCVIAGIDWVTDRKLEFNDGAGDGDAGINLRAANLSLGGGTNVGMCNAIATAVAQGVIVAVAAGNDSGDANNSGPANCTNAIAVSAFADFDGKPGALQNYENDPPGCTTGPGCSTSPVTLCEENQDDTFACFSNFGPAVDIAAPGVNMWSTYTNGMYAQMSGTSMAAPHMAGAALLLRLNGYAGSAAPASVITVLTSTGWTRTQASACGFTGDTDGNSEPVLFVGSSNCAGPTPSPTPQVCSGDTDCDGFSDAAEGTIGTAPFQGCSTDILPNNETPDAWPLDTNDDKGANTLDLTPFVQSLNTIIGQPGYSARTDLTLDGRVNTLDLVPYVAALNTHC